MHLENQLMLSRRAVKLQDEIMHVVMTILLLQYESSAQIRIRDK